MPLLLQLMISFNQTFSECSLPQCPQKLLIEILNLKFFKKDCNLTLWPMGKCKIANILEIGRRRAKQSEIWDGGGVVSNIYEGYLLFQCLRSFGGYFGALVHCSHECLISLRGSLKDYVVHGNSPQGLQLIYGRRGYQVCMQMQLSWMVKANDYMKFVNLVMITIDQFI